MTVLPSVFGESSNNLTSIKQELQRIVIDNNSLKNFVGGLLSIKRNTERLEKLVNDILDTSRIEGNRLNLEKESFNLNEKIQNVVRDIHSKKNLDSFYDKPSKQINILFEPQEDPINVFADKIRIFEVISNLTSNTIKFYDGQPIIISSKKIMKKEIREYNYLNQHGEKHAVNKTESNDKDAIMAVVSIRDKGKGIDPDILPRLFTKFATKSSQGTGLGLYIAKSIVEAHGGQIWAQHNIDYGKGAVFTFSLPLG